MVLSLEGRTPRRPSPPARKVGTCSLGTPGKEHPGSWPALLAEGTAPAGTCLHRPPFPFPPAPRHHSLQPHLQGRVPGSWPVERALFNPEGGCTPSCQEAMAFTQRPRTALWAEQCGRVPGRSRLLSRREKGDPSGNYMDGDRMKRLSKNRARGGKTAWWSGYHCPSRTRIKLAAPTATCNSSSRG